MQVVLFKYTYIIHHVCVAVHMYIHTYIDLFCFGKKLINKTNRKKYLLATRLAVHQRDHFQNCLFILINTKCVIVLITIYSLYVVSSYDRT